MLEVYALVCAKCSQFAALSVSACQARLEAAKTQFTVHEQYAASASQRVITTETRARNGLQAWQHRTHAQMLLANGQIEATRIALQDAAELEAASTQIVADSTQKADDLHAAAETLKKHLVELEEPIASLVREHQIASTKVKAIRPDTRSHRQRWIDRGEAGKLHGDSYRQRLRKQEAEVEATAAAKEVDAAAAEEAAVERAIVDQELEIGEKAAQGLYEQVGLHLSITGSGLTLCVVLCCSG